MDRVSVLVGSIEDGSFAMCVCTCTCVSGLVLIF